MNLRSPRLHISVCSFLAFCTYSDFSVPEVWVATITESQRYLWFLTLVVPFWCFLLQDLLAVQSSAHCVWTAYGRLAAPQTSSTSPQCLVRHLNEDPGISDTPPLSLLQAFLKKLLCVHILCRGKRLSRCKELPYSETYWALKRSVYCLWKHPHREPWI